MCQSDRYLIYSFFLYIFLTPLFGFSQEVKSVPNAFEALSKDPAAILLTNELQVPLARGHLQGVQLIEKDGIKKLLLSGSSLSESYVLQVDLESQKTDRLYTLMHAPYRHAGGIQISGPYLAVGIEDNFKKTTSKVCLYNYLKKGLNTADINLTIKREGAPKDYTAGTSGILKLENDYLVLVSNWDSRDWDFYKVDPDQKEQEFLYRFTAPDDWGSYQSINLIMDDECIYGIGTFQKDANGVADLFFISKRESFEPSLELVGRRLFQCSKNVDFSTAAGIEVDSNGKLHLWATQRDATKRIIINRFSEK